MKLSTTCRQFQAQGLQDKKLSHDALINHGIQGVGVGAVGVETDQLEG